MQSPPVEHAESFKRVCRNSQEGELYFPGVELNFPGGRNESPRGKCKNSKKEKLYLQRVQNLPGGKLVTPRQKCSFFQETLNRPRDYID